ncbi:hypothetical protein [Hydrogenophaga aquatica]
MQRKTIIGAGIVGATILIGWLAFGQQSYEGCLKSAAKAANGVPMAYHDLRSICDDKHAEGGISFSDLIPKK